MSVNKNVNGTLQRIAGGTLYADAPIGSIQAYGGATIPKNWLLCDGSALSRTTYAELFAVIGTSFGAGDGNTTFNIPDLREAVPVGTGTRASGITSHDTYDIGQFKDDQLQDHVHMVGASGSQSQAHWYASNYGDSNVSGSTTGKTLGMYTDTAYGGVPVPRVGTTTHGKQLGVNYIIKAQQTALPLDIQEKYDELDDRISSNTFGSPVDISPYNSSSNQYTCPSDGYINISTGVNVDDYMIAMVNNRYAGAVYCSKAGWSGIQSIFVKKGMKVYKNGGTTGSNIQFIPLV